MKSKAEIKIDHSTYDVVVLDELGKEVFRKSKTYQNISIANTIFMYHKYHTQSENIHR